MVNTSALVVPKAGPDGRVIMCSRFEWDPVREQAAVDIADGTYRVREVADRCGVDVNTIYSWRKHPDFIDRVNALMDEIRQRTADLGIARVETRVQAKNERWLALQQVIKERAEARYPVEGGTTGMLARDTKMIGAGENATLVDVYEVDCGLLKAINELEKEASIELGQRLEKKEITSKDGGVLHTQAVELASLMTPDELEMLKRRLQERAAANGVPEIVQALAESAEPVVEPDAEMIAEEFPVEELPAE